MKKQNGMSHITGTICVMIIIIACIFAGVSLTRERKERNKENLITDMLLVQGKIKVIAQENIVNNEEHPLIGKKVVDNLENEKVKKLLDDKIISSEQENFDKLYIIDNEELEKLDLNNKLEDECYIVNYADYEIIYSKGLKIDGETYYTLTQLLKYEEKKENEGKVNQENNEPQKEEQTQQTEQ